MLCLLIGLLTTTISNDVNVSFMLKEAETRYGLPNGLLQALAHVETKTNYRAFTKHDGHSGHSSYGLLQIQLASAQMVGFKGAPKQLMTPSTNIEYGALYLKWLLKHTHNDVALSLTCFNAGPSSSLCKEKRYGKYSGLVLNAWISKKDN